MVLCYQIALRVTGSAKLSIEHSLSLYSTADVYNSSSRHGAREETAVAQRLATQYICKCFEGLLRHPILTPKTVGAALVEVFTVILPVEATTPFGEAPPDIGGEHGVCNP